MDGRAIGVDSIGACGGLKEVHIFGVFTDLAVGEAMHPAARVLPFARGEKVSIPRLGHFGFGIVVPVFAAASAWVVADFAD